MVCLRLWPVAWAVIARARSMGEALGLTCVGAWAFD